MSAKLASKEQTKNEDTVELRRANVALVQRWVDALNAPWDFAAMEDIFAEDVVYGLVWVPEEMGFPTRLEGREETIEFIRSMVDFVDPENAHNVRINTFHDDPNELLAEYSVDTRLKTTGEPYKNDLLIRIGVRDGRIARFAEHFDLYRLLIPMGGGIKLPEPAEDAA
jgi:ketosteroid isomerase-like protein